MSEIDDISPEKLKEAAARLLKLKDDAFAEMLAYKDSLPKVPALGQKLHLARLNGIIVGLAQAAFEFDKSLPRPRSGPLTLRDRWALEDEMVVKGEWTGFVNVPKKDADPAPEQREDAISPKTDELLSKLKGRPRGEDSQ